MHTEHLAGKPGSTLQGMLPILLKGYPDSRLMNRLDYATSGLITAALDEYGIHSYRRLQETGHTEKRYLALLEGKLSHRLRVDSQLDLTHRDRVYALSKHHSNPVRHTLLEPLSVIPTLSFLQALKAISPALVQYMKGSIPPYITLTGCTIFKGARHQIRAHASSLGYPLLGDKRYGSSTIPVEYPDELFFLHHASFLLPQIKISILPIWLNCMGEEANHAARIWLES
jgi:23S rRNA pseudouridine1911/1915/1917 synthase